MNIVVKENSVVFESGVVKIVWGKGSFIYKIDKGNVVFTHVEEKQTLTCHENDISINETKVKIDELPDKLDSLLASPASKGDKGDKGDPGEKGAAGAKGDTGVAGAKGADGKSITAIALTADDEGKITGGKATLSDNSTINITVTTA